MSVLKELETIRADGLTYIIGYLDDDSLSDNEKLLMIRAACVDALDRLAAASAPERQARLRAEAERDKLREALEIGVTFEREYQHSLGATWTEHQQAVIDAAQRAFINAYRAALAAAGPDGGAGVMGTERLTAEQFLARAWLGLDGEHEPHCEPDGAPDDRFTYCSLCKSAMEVLDAFAAGPDGEQDGEQ